MQKINTTLPPATSFQFLNDYWTLTKPRVVLLMLITSIVGMLLAAKTPIAWDTFFWTMIGLGFAMGGAAAINQTLDEHIDKIMQRTQERPVASGRIQPLNAFIFSGILCTTSMLILYFFINPLTALLTFIGVVTYAFTYTLFLKRATPQNIVIGGIAGALPPLLGWTAVTGAVHPHAWLLVLIIFVWTPPHFWALSVHRCNDYKNAAIPMLPVTHGIEFTKNNIILYTALLLLCCLLPYLTGMSGKIYLFGTLAINLLFLYHTIKLKLDKTNQHAMKTFTFSIIHLFLLFIFLLVDHYFAVPAF